MMPNGFLLVRCVFFALLTLLTLLTLSFASWNIGSSLRADQNGTITSGLIVFECCTFCIFTILAFLPVFRPNANTSRVSVECGWVGLIALFQLGAAISATVNGPTSGCSPPANVDMCASASLLVPSMWSKSLLSFGYFFLLFIATLAHRDSRENIWKETLYTVAWFEPSTDHPNVELGQDLPEKSNNYGWDLESSAGNTRHLQGIESTAARKNPPRNSTKTAPWAQKIPIRRGVDSPFSVSPTSSPATTSQPLPPAPPLKSATSKLSNSSRFIERFRESRVLSRFEIPFLSPNHFMNSSHSEFPSSIVDHDKPIPLPRLSEWVRADDIRS